MNKKFSFTSTLLLLFLSTFSQPFNEKFGKISMEEMEMKICPIDSSAEATFLFDIGETKMVYDNILKEFQLQFSRHFRVKILKKEGLENGNFEVNLFHTASNYESLSQFKGVTYNLVNGKIEKFKIEKENKFEEKKNSNLITRKIAFPKVEVGSVLECEYSILSNFFFNFQPWYFQSSIPVLQSRYDTYIVDWYDYNFHLSGYEPVKVDVSEPKTKTFRYTWEEIGAFGVKTNYYKDYEYKEISRSYTANNLPSIRSEVLVDDIDNYVSRIDFELAVVRIPNQIIKNYSTSWEAVSKELLENEDFGKQLDGGSYMQDDLNKLVIDVLKPEDKISIIRSFIFNKIKWNEENGILVEKGVRSAYRLGLGNIVEVNLNLIIALRKVGFEVDPVVLSTRSHGRVFDWKKEINGFNYVVAGVRLEDKLILVDAATSNQFIGLLPMKCLNGQGRIINPVKSEWIDLNPKTISKKSVYATFSFDKDLKIFGKVTETYRDYSALKLAESIKGDEELKSKKDDISKTFNNWRIDSLNISANPNKIPEIKETYYVLSEDSITTGDNVIFVAPSKWFGVGLNPFVKQERKFPVNYSFPQEESSIIKIDIPDGFRVDELPTNISYSIPENGGKYLFSCQLVGNTIVIVNKFTISKVEYSFLEYPALRSFYDEVIKKQNEKIVLKRI